jgi:hypothetical protein
VSMLAIGAVRSCGATTLATGLARTWVPGQRLLLAELDPAGGVLAARFALAAEPGMVSLATAARRRGDRDLVWEHTQQLTDDGPVVLMGPAAAGQARAALGMLTDRLAGLGRLGADVIADCGRLDPDSPAWPVAVAADLLVVAARPQLADLHSLAGWLEGRRPELTALGVVLIGDGPYPPSEVADALGVEVLAALPADRDGAAAVNAPTPVRALARTRLGRGLASLAKTLSGALSGSDDEATAPDDAGVPAAEPQMAGQVVRA